MSRPRKRGQRSDAALAPSCVALDRVVVVLVHTDGEQNVGSVARLCGNFGATLRLVAPRAALHVRDALKMAHPCEATLLQAQPYATLDDALVDIDFALATSGKIRGALDTEPLDIERARLLWPADDQRIALVFGNERTGLAATDAERCDRILRLPTPGPVESLNLASAVAVALTLFAEAGRGDVAPRAPKAQRDALTVAIEHSLADAGFYDGSDRQAFAPRLHELVGKMDFNVGDIQLMRQLFNCISGARERGARKDEQAGSVESRQDFA